MNRLFLSLVVICLGVVGTSIMNSMIVQAESFPEEDDHMDADAVNLNEGDVGGSEDNHEKWRGEEEEMTEDDEGRERARPSMRMRGCSRRRCRRGRKCVQRCSFKCVQGNLANAEECAATEVGARCCNETDAEGKKTEFGFCGNINNVICNYISFTCVECGKAEDQFCCQNRSKTIEEGRYKCPTGLSCSSGTCYNASKGRLILHCELGSLPPLSFSDSELE